MLKKKTFPHRNFQLGQLSNQTKIFVEREFRDIFLLLGPPKSGFHGLGTGIYMILGGGFKYFFYFHPENWGRRTQFDEHIFQDGVGSTTNQGSKTGILPNSSRNLGVYVSICPGHVVWRFAIWL